MAKVPPRSRSTPPRPLTAPQPYPRLGRRRQRQSRFHHQPLAISGYDGYRDHSGAILDKTFAKLTLYPDDLSKLSLSFAANWIRTTPGLQGLEWKDVKSQPACCRA